MSRLSKVLLCVAPALLYSTVTASANASSDSNSNLVNVAPTSKIITAVSGPVDTKFHANERRWSSPVTSAAPNWARYDKQIGRDITINTYYYRPISSISITMEQNPNAGVYYPQEVTFEVLENGQWRLLGSVKTQIPASDKNVTTQTFTMPCNDIYASEFRVHFPVSNWVFANNLQVLADNYATPTSGSTTNLPLAPEPVDSPLHIGDPNAYNIHDMLLVYTGANGSLGTWTNHDFAPMVTYVNKAGKPSGRLFNTVLFLPYGSMPDTKAGWQAYLTQLFAPHLNLSALNEDVVQANQALSIYGGNSFKENVVLGLPNPQFGDGVWGNSDSGSTLSFKGSEVDPGAAKARSQAIDWFLNQVMSDWKEAGYTNLNLVGFYWLNEQLKYTIPGQTDFFQNGVDAVHQLGYPLFWIPSYDASGLDQWSNIGFDAAWLQSNYVLLGTHAPIQRLTNSAALAKDYGLGIEVEVPDQSLHSQTYRNMYEESLKAFTASGLGSNISHAFYAGSKTLVRAAQSKNPSVRAIYDETYGFVNHY